MAFAPVFGRGLSSYAKLQSLLSKSFTSLAALCSPLLAAILALVDDLARQIPPSCCIVCWAQGLRKSYSNTKDKKIALIFDPHTAIYTLKEVDIDRESIVHLLQLHL